MTPDPDLVDRIVARRAEVEDRIRVAGGVPGPDGVTILAVTKTHPPAVAAAAVAAGLVDLGENYAAELADKAPQVSGARWHFIGQLQTNKVRLVAPVVDVVQSVDRSSLVRELAKRRPGAIVFVQVDLAGVAGRGGVAPDGALALADECHAAGLVVDGVMGVAPIGDEAVVGAAFAGLRRLADRLGVRHCSMGMSDDLELAVREGSTMIRVGTALFGSRR